jgi:hypothetical protein
MSNTRAEKEREVELNRCPLCQCSRSRRRFRDAAAAKCVSCEALITEAKSLKSCKACKAGTAFDVTAAKCVKVTVAK